MNSQVFFNDRVPQAFREAPEVFRLGCSYRFRVSGERGGDWTLELGDRPRCRREANAPVACTINISDQDFERLVDNPRTARTLFGSGRIRVEGSIDLAIHLPSLIAIIKPPKVPGGLSALLGAINKRRFLDEYWPDRLILIQAPLNRLSGIADIPVLASVEELLACWPGQVRLSDRSSGRLVEVSEAKILYAAGEHLAFSDVERVVPELRGELERVRWDLQLPVSTYGRCLAYASPAGSGEVLHFDQNVNFVVQLSGEKRWRVAPNAHVRNPTDRYTTACPELSPELRLYAPENLPTCLPEGSENITLKPGAVLFLPRGYWHETQAVTNSLSLNFTFDQPTWVDVFLPEIRRRLLAADRWRELAKGAGAPQRDVAERAVTHLQELIVQLSTELADARRTAQTALAGLTLTEAEDAPFTAKQHSENVPTREAQ